MVGLGFTLATVSLFLLACFFIRPEYLYRPLTLRLLALLTPCGFICLEAGWVVTEVGRQPWIIYKVMKVQEALTPMQGMQFSFFMYLALYGFLTFVVTWLFTRQLKASGNL
jgi:cytochrome d ubiquinol oxidase subunit I